ncbi:MAG: FAD-dependent oxidoreductase [Candidatus Microsaccharimonas sp.]
MERFNNILRPISMYKGISFGLTAIWLNAFVLALFGVLSFNPWAMLASLLVFGFSTYIASIICGRLFGVGTHAESSYITGGILALIFNPTLVPAMLVVYAFIGLIAGVSKYIIVLSGRHIFNPAAFAAVVIAFTGLASAHWWVASPLLTPIVALVAFVSLYQTKRLTVAGVFLAISVPILVIQFLAFGVTFGESLLLLLSWPLIFIAGIMLTEPLTLPPRKWQMYIVAAVVGVFVAWPVNLGVTEMTPALAIVVGNVIAAVFARRSAVLISLKKRHALTPTSDEFIFETNKPLRYISGQYVEIELPHKKADLRGERRMFSLTSAPGKNEISLGVKFYEPSSSFKKALKALVKDSTLRITNVSGDFVLPKNVETPIVMIAGGIGITPFISQLRWLQKVGQTRDVALIYAVKSVDEIAYKDLLVQSAIQVVIVAPTQPSDMPRNWIYQQGSRVDFGALTSLIEGRVAYISGPTPFVANAKNAVRNLGLTRIKTDYFTGY